LEVLRARCGPESHDWPPIRATTQQFAGKTPPRTQEFSLERLENNYCSLWILPKAGGSVIRWRDGQSGVDLLSGFQTFLGGRGLLQEWSHGAEAADGPISGTYELSTRTFDTLTLRASLDNGLLVERRMTLERGSPELRVLLTVRNPTDQPIAPKMSLRPEFRTPAEELPQVWAFSGTRWVKLEPPPHRGYLDPAGYSRWALFLPRQRLSVLNSFEQKEVGALLYSYEVDLSGQYVSLALVVPDNPIPPRQSRTLHLSYIVTSKSPDRL